MLYKNIHLIYFSPTHTSAKIAYAMAEELGGGHMLETDLTYADPLAKVYVEDSLTILAAPVYGGRVAETAMERFQQIEANNSLVIPVVLYGNRDYEDALLELCDFSVMLGFTPVAAGAFVGEHSFSRADMPIAACRPDVSDLSAAAGFMKKVEQKLVNYSALKDIPELKVKGHFPYKVKGPSAPAAPVTVENLCTQCGHCVEICPTQAINMRTSGELDSDKTKCIKCCACVKECPQEARIFDTPYTAMLFNNFKVRREPELFV